jgi:predicted nucleotidyltransferase
MEIMDLLEEKREEILRIAAGHGVRSIRIFGSVARGEAGKDSDIDFLVELEEDRSLLDQGALGLDLRDLLRREVHVVTEESLYWLIRRKVLKEARPF